jgi:hypothetical protein
VSYVPVASVATGLLYWDDIKRSRGVRCFTNQIQALQAEIWLVDVILLAVVDRDSLRQADPAALRALD